MQKFKRGQTIGSKVMAILTRYSSLADKTASSPCSHYIETPRKPTSGNSCKTLRVIQRSDRKSGWPDLLVYELRFHSNPKENGLWKLMQKFKRDPTVGSKVMAILTLYSSIVDQTSSSPSWDSTSTQRKTTLGNSWKNFRAIQWSNRKLWPFLTVT